MAVIGGDDQKRVRVVREFIGGGHGLGEGGAVGHGAIKVAGMVGVVHAARLDLEIVAVLAPGGLEILDGRAGHVGERGLVLVGAVVLVLHVRVVEEREHGRRAVEVERIEGLGVPRVLRARVHGLLNVVDAVGTVPVAALVGGGPLGHEVAAPAAHREVDHPCLHLIHQLGGDVLGPLAPFGNGILPVAARRLGIDGGRGGVGQAGRGDDADGLVHAADHLREGGQAVAFLGRAILVDGAGRVEVEGVEDLLDARVHRRRGRRAVGGLGVDVVGLHQRRMEVGALVGQHVVVTETALLLAHEESRGVVGADAVAVRDHQDHIPGPVRVGLAVQDLLDGGLAGGEPLVARLRQVLCVDRARRADGEGGCADAMGHSFLLSDAGAPLAAPLPSSMKAGRQVRDNLRLPTPPPADQR